MKNIVTCAQCGKTFVSSWSHEEAIAEMVKEFGQVPPPEQIASVCDMCYIEIIANKEGHG